MAKFYGTVGYASEGELEDDVSRLQYVERKYYGDMSQQVRRYVAGEGLNSNLTLQNEISIIADAYAYNHFSQIRYVEYLGAKWEVTSARVDHPRINLSIGGVFNEH